MKMKVRLIRSIGICLLLLSVLFGEKAAGEGLVYPGIDRKAFHEEAVPLRVSRRPKLARIPNLDIYYTPELRYNLYMADKRWYLLHNDKWYQGQTHEGPWRYLTFSKVPESLKKIPDAFIKKENAPLPNKKPPKPAKKKPSKEQASSKSIKSTQKP